MRATVRLEVDLTCGHCGKVIDRTWTTTEPVQPAQLVHEQQRAMSSVIAEALDRGWADAKARGSDTTETLCAVCIAERRDVHDSEQHK